MYEAGAYPGMSGGVAFFWGEGGHKVTENKHFYF